MTDFAKLNENDFAKLSLINMQKFKNKNTDQIIYI